MTLVDNQVFVGLAGAMLMGSVLYVIKAVPTHAFWALVGAVTVEVVVESDDDAFSWVSEWLARHSYATRARRLTLGASRADEDRWSLSPGFGRHLIWHRGRPVMFDRELKDGEKGDRRVRQRITIKSFGRDQRFLRELLAEADGLRTRRDALVSRVWCDGYWQKLPNREKRGLDTVFLPAETKAAMIRHASWFFGGARWYAARGIPYRLGWLLSGAPGTGKTSTVMALAAHFDRPIYCLNISTVRDDNALMGAFLSADKECILLLEDIDAAAPATTRESDDKDDSPGKVTLSGLLNAIDGVGSPDGRLLVMTSNFPERLDRALVRPGRVDREYDFGDALAPEQVREMATRFFPDRTDAVDVESKRTAAEWQRHFLQTVHAGGQS